MKKRVKRIVEYIIKTTKKLRCQFWRAKCRYIKYYETLSVDEKAILLESQSATKVSGNIYAILKYITSNEQYSSYTIYLSSWGRYMKAIQQVLDNAQIKNVKLVLYHSDEYVRLLASAKFLINDATFPFYFIKKEGQIYLNTWHGTPLKAMGKSIKNDISMGNVQKNLVSSDCLLYPNEFTKRVMLRDYMLENISQGVTVLGGYPRNAAFFDSVRREELREKFELTNKKIYAYMPTWRGTVSNVGSNRNNTYLMYYLYELDKLLQDDEVLYINLHPMAMHAKNDVEIKSLKHIQRFPVGYETYEFLNLADVLVTDYSSVFFDFACTRRKIVLFPYDKEEYLRERGMYLDTDELPFPQVFDVAHLVGELRSGIDYDDTKFVKTYCPYDNINATQQLCDRVFFGVDTGVRVEEIPNNGKENVLLYAGDLAKNGITTSLRSLTNNIDLKQRNYYISFCQGKVKKNAAQLATFHEGVGFFAVAEAWNFTIWDRMLKKLWKEKLLMTSRYMKLQGKRYEQNFRRAYGTAKFDTAIQFNGYEDDILLTYSAFSGRKAIWVHSDMLGEIETRGNQRRDVLEYVYNVNDKVVAVSEDIKKSTVQISKREDNLITVKNTIDYKSVRKKSEHSITLDKTTTCSVSLKYFEEIIRSDAKKIINVARFSPEKGHERLVDAFYKLWQKDSNIYLIIMGGNSKNNGFQKLKDKVAELGLQENVILLLSVSNPFPIVKACDYFILSSFYEGFGLVLAEADILGLPVVSTNINGPRGFMSRYGGVLVENSEEGIYQGLSLLLAGKVEPLDIDYDAYNAECIEEFERVFR